ncbi:MAG: ABC transporter ATP-binding protein [Candidatus Dormibacteria bacterium]
MNVLRGTRFLLALGFRLDPRRLCRAMALMFAGYISAPFAALALAGLTDDALGHDRAGALTLAVVVAVLLVAQLMLSHFAHLDYFELAEMQQARLRVELMELVNRPNTISHLDDPDFADNHSLVRESLFGTTRALESTLQLIGLLIQTLITIVLLVRVNPWLVLLPVVALVPVAAGQRAQRLLERAREATAEQVRLHRHLLQLSTQASSVKELRLFGTEAELMSRQQAAWETVTRRMWRAQALAAVVKAGGQVVFAAGYGAAILLVVLQAGGGHGSIGNLVLVITLAVQVSVQVAGALGLLSFLQTAALTTRRIEKLRAAAPPPAPRPAGGPRVPGRLEEGLVLENVGFSYPGAAVPVLDGVSLHVPAGSTLALVGENGAGKSTLVKLLCGLYLPTAGRILVDGVDLADLDPVEWRRRVATLFQDFSRIELTLGESVGLGEVAEMGDRERVASALTAARGERILATVPGGLEGYIGRAYHDGVDLSGGQWQTVGLGRCLMRERPLLLALDEPAAALDAAAEHSLFERYASSAASGGIRVGSVTVLVSHRFSTVLMADSIAVLEGGRLIESGSHAELMARGGLYAELFQLQARAYR